jgi:hypothetical protein
MENEAEENELGILRELWRQVFCQKPEREQGVS